METTDHVEVNAVAGIIGLTIEGIPPIDGLEIADELKITTDRIFLRQFIRQAFENDLGNIEANSIVDGGVAAFALLAHPGAELSERDARSFAFQFHRIAEGLLLGLWLVKDHSGNIGDTWLCTVYPNGSSHSYRHRVTGASWMADGEMRTTNVTRAELDEAIQFAKMSNSALELVKWDFNAPRPSGVAQRSALARTLYFVQAARAEPDLALKIAFFCICFESLFSTDEAGIAHRVAERTALFLGTTGAEQRAIYDDVHTLYGRRSKVVHGSSIKDTERPDWIARLVRADNYLRRCLVRILTDPELRELFSERNEQAIRTYFTNALFPDREVRPANEATAN